MRGRLCRKLDQCYSKASYAAFFILNDMRLQLGIKSYLENTQTLS